MSLVSETTFVLIPKMEPPAILPATLVFTISATLEFMSSDPNAAVYFTVDGPDPTEESFSLTSGGTVVIEEPGVHVIKAYCIDPSQVAAPSAVTVRTITVLARLSPPLLVPSGGLFLGDLSVKCVCPDLTVNASVARVHYTIAAGHTPSAASPSVPCGGILSLYAPEKYTVRLFVVSEGMSPSAIVQGLFELQLPPFDSHPMANPPYQVNPDVQVLVIEKDFPPTRFGCDQRDVRGRLVILANPLGHFDIVEPAGGCSGGRTLPSVAGRHYSPPSAPSAPLAEPPSEEQLLRWQAEFSAAAGLGCQLVTNAGFFNVSSGACIGNLVTDSRVVQLTSAHNVNFGMRNGSFFTGYVTPEEARQLPFDTLVSGLGWLVRAGRPYIDQSLVGDGEDPSAQATGSLATFSAVLSARTAIGYDRLGRLLILQTEGETWRKGLNLQEFASLAAELGFLSAVNLDGGGSATMTQNHSLISEPSWKCAPGTNTADPFETESVFCCEKPVASITCMHAMAPPATSSHSADPSARPTSASVAPSAQPAAAIVSHNSTLQSLQQLKEAVVAARMSSLVLLVLLSLSLLLNMALCCRRAPPSHRPAVEMTSAAARPAPSPQSAWQQRQRQTASLDDSDEDCESHPAARWPALTARPYAQVRTEDEEDLHVNPFSTGRR